MHEILLSAGPIAFEDTMGPGPVVVLLHGLAMDGSVWSQVVQELSPDHRCLVPTMPLGSHRKPMREDADLSAPGIARLVAELLVLNSSSSDRIRKEVVENRQEERGAQDPASTSTPG
jgi:pimeloyl-ACP methyl ester carboxylesterase